ncbi:MAG: hypothetical protein NWE75_01460, partial [Candidatus Bathyarchaeota archaeon]|nr:hypothetical protein [Candidatus Bathyarchaeota archaeon]
MNIAEYMFLGAAALVFLDLAYLMNPRDRGRKVLPPLAPIACLLIIGSYVILAKAFVEGDFRYAEVYSYSSSGLPTLSRIYASWASSAGSWLFLSFLFSIGCLVLR